MYAAEMAGPIHLGSDLEALVRAYAPKGDSWSHEWALRVLDNDRPMWPRTEFDPGHFTASAFVVSVDGDSILLIHHAKLGRWLQPGGHIEVDDASIEGATRRADCAPPQQRDLVLGAVVEMRDNRVSGCQT